MADNRRDMGSHQKITGAQLEKLGIRPKPIYINREVFKKTSAEKLKLANAKLVYNNSVKLDPSRNRILQDQLANEMLTSGTPRWGSFSLNGHKFGY